MITNLSELSKKEISESSEGVKMRLSDDSATIVFQMFINHNYSNPIGSICREIASNCFDSHIEAGITLPILIKKTHDAETDHHYISFIDFGVGLSPERIEKIYGVLFASTKRANNEQIGGYGIGSKSILAYKRKTGMGSEEYDNSFFVITTYNGIKYYYCIYEGNNCPVINLLHSESTTDGNGTEVRVQVLKNDIQKFENELFRQLYYFENIVFEGFDNYNGNLTNDYQIIKAKNFIFRGNKYRNDIHVCLGRVAYRIDYDVVDIADRDYNYPIALKFDIGELNVTKSREDLDYSEETIKAIKAKIVLAKAELTEMLGKQFDSVVELEDYFKTDKKNLVLNLSPTHTIGLDKNKFKIQYNNFKYKHLNLPNEDTMFNLFFTTGIMGKKESRNDSYYSRNTFNRTYGNIVNCKNLYWLNHDFEKNMLLTSYIRSINDRYYMIYMKDQPVVQPNDIRKYFKDSVATDQDILDLFDDMTAIVKANTIDYDKIIIPPSYIAEKKANRSKSRETGTAVVNFHFSGSYRNQYRVMIKDLHNFQGTIIYGTKEQSNKLLIVSKIVSAIFKVPVITGYQVISKKFIHENGSDNSRSKPKSNIMVVYVADGNLKHFKRCYKAIPVDQFNVRMLYRKHDEINRTITNEELNDKKYYVNKLFLNKKFIALHPEMADNILKVAKFNPVINKTITNLRYLLENFMKIDNAYTKADKEFVKTVDALKELDSKYEKLLKYVSIPHSLSDNDYPEFWSLIKLIGENL